MHEKGNSERAELWQLRRDISSPFSKKVTRNLEAALGGGGRGVFTSLSVVGSERWILLSESNRVELSPVCFNCSLHPHSQTSVRFQQILHNRTHL
jgi:hypothetical protein